MAVKWFNYREMKLFYIFFQSICKREGFRQSRIDGVDTFHIIFRYMICVFYGRYHFTKMLYYAIQSIFDISSGASAVFCQFSHLSGNNGKAPSGFATPCGFNGWMHSEPKYWTVRHFV